MDTSKHFSAYAIGAALIATLASASPALAQSSNGHPYGLDPYKPSDAQLLRFYGAALVGQTPVDQLATLDPYKPSDAELLRQAGGAIPLFYGYWTWPGPTLVPPPPVPQRLDVPLTATFTQTTRRAAAESDSRSLVRSAVIPSSNDGIWIEFEGRRWATAGRAVSLREEGFRLVGMYGDQPVFARTDAADEMIYVQVRARTLVPFKEKS